MKKWPNLLFVVIFVAAIIYLNSHAGQPGR